MPKKIMIQGTSSGAGKSMISTALCRIFTNDGYEVAPFKPQNMALNSFVTTQGLEMGRAQVVQAEACNKIPNVNMNPILLKPTGNGVSQVIVQGKIWDNMDSFEYKSRKIELIPKIQESYDKLASENDIIVIEGAGSPAELNMMDNDISNMKSAEILDAPVVIVADIDRGGVFASIYGTIKLQTPENQSRIKGIIINKFKGNKKLLESAINKIEELTGVTVLGVLPYTKINLEDEDSITEKVIYSKSEGNKINIEIVKFPHLSNSTDFEILRHFENTNVRFVELDESFSSPDLIILPGTKNTIADLVELKNSQLLTQIYDLHKNKNIPIIAICGGFQMLGKLIKDPQHLEDKIDEIAGLGLLNHITTFKEGKITTQSKAKIQDIKFNKDSIFYGLEGKYVSGYELHSGVTEVDYENDIEFTRVKQVLEKEADHTDGMINKSGTVLGTYFHGIFDNIEFTRIILDNIKNKKGIEKSSAEFDYKEFKEKEFKKLEKIFRENIDIKKIYEILK